MTTQSEYALITYMGNDDGEQCQEGTCWWAYCKELDCRGDGETRQAAIENCLEGMALKCKIMSEKGIPLPKVHMFVPDETYSGKLMLRLPKSLHKELVEEADREGVSLNGYIQFCLASRHKKQTAVTIQGVTRFSGLTSASASSGNGKIIQFPAPANDSYRQVQEG